MRTGWEAVQVSLRVFLKEDEDHTCFLESIATDLARRLRFKRQSRSGLLVESLAFDRFIETAAQLRHYHLFFQEKLKPMTEPSMQKGSTSAAQKLCSFVEIIADMLSILRVQYGQLFCRSEATRAALNTALKTEITNWDGIVLQNYLKEQQLCTEKLVDRPLKRFNELIEFLKALSSSLTEDNGDGADSDAIEQENVDYAHQLLHIAQESKRYICLATDAANEEEELITLQTSYCGDGAEFFHDLSANKVLLHGEVFLSERDSSQVGSKAAATGMKPSFQPKPVYIHCYQDGTFVYSKWQISALKSGSSFRILRHLQLKQDAIFLEQTPANVSRLMSSDDSHALALILQSTILIFSWRDPLTCQRWFDTIGGLLELNGLRTEKLLKDRAIGDLPVSVTIEAQLVEMNTLPTEFASFFDDHLPGIFWVTCENGSDSSKPRWKLVEVALHAQWLIIYEINGWREHFVLCRFDTHKPMLEISEQLRGDKEWSLSISDGSASSLTLVSKKRTRIDFWFDQVSKAVESAKKAAWRAEREVREPQKVGYQKTNIFDDNNKKGVRAGIKRKLEVVSDKVKISVDEKDSFLKQSSAGSGCDLSDDDMDKNCGGHNRTTSTVTVDGEYFAEFSATKKSHRLAQKSQQPFSMTSSLENTNFASVTSPAFETRKRRSMKTKITIPEDNDLVSPQPCPNILPDASCEIDTRFPTNEAAVEKPKLQRVRIILTGVEPTAAIRKKIHSIAGAVYEEDIEKATHVLAPKNQLKRTVKLLCGISRCSHVLDVRWLDESARIGAPIFERVHCLKDTKAEAKWHFNLRKTMYDFTSEQRKQLFAGQKVFITNHKSVLPPVKDLVKIVECAGGIAVTKGRAHQSNVVVTSETALSTASVRKTLAQADPQRIYSVELILSSILQQRIDFDKNRLGQAGGGSCRRKEILK